jgi:DNA invertase Pin-like site-specific DNA recombinase
VSRRLWDIQTIWEARAFVVDLLNRQIAENEPAKEAAVNDIAVNSLRILQFPGRHGARQRYGTRSGRPSNLTEALKEKIVELRASGTGILKIAKATHVGTRLVMRVLEGGI